MMRPNAAPRSERAYAMREIRYRENQRAIELPAITARAPVPDRLDPRLLTLLPHRPKLWREFVEGIPAELVEFWIAREPRHCLLAEFASTSGQWRCLWHSGDIEAYPQQGIRHRVLLVNREEADRIKAAHPLVDISLSDQTTRLRFRRTGEGDASRLIHPCARSGRI